MKEVTRELQLAAGENKSIAISLTEKAAEPEQPPAAPAPQPDRPAVVEAEVTAAEEKPSTGLRTAGFVVGAVGVVGVAAFAVTGIMARNKYSTLEGKCGDERCTGPAMQEVVDQGRTLQTVANVSLIVGAVGLVAGGTMVYFGWPSEAAGQPQTAGLSLNLSPSAATVGYSGAF